MTFDHHAMVQPAIPLPGGERWTCWLDLSETYRRGRNCGETGSWRPPDEAGQSHMTSVPQTPDGKHSAVAKLVGAGFKPALVPQARCERIAVISCAIEVRTAKLGSTSHTVNAERGRVGGAPQKTHPRFLGTPVPSRPYKNHQRSAALLPRFGVRLAHMRLPC